MSSGSPTPPLVSIGLPTFERPEQLERALRSICAQTYAHLEIIVSDNASTDVRVTQVLHRFTSDSRISVHRQPTNVGALRNFRFVLAQARGQFFMWWADDDVRTSDFVSANVAMLLEDTMCVASTSPFVVGDENGDQVCVTLAGSMERRYRIFLEHAWHSNGLFYSIMRTDAARSFSASDWRDYFAFDWTFILHLAAQGDLRCIDRGLAVLGAGGESQQSASWRRYTRLGVRFFVPLFDFTREVVRRTRGLTQTARLRLLTRVVRLNVELNRWRARHYLRSKLPDYILAGMRLIRTRLRSR